jgi:hypothetical protein
MLTITITIDLSKHARPTLAELEARGYQYEVDYWIELLYADPALMLDSAKFVLQRPPHPTKE